jgi:hypothetical protein
MSAVRAALCSIAASLLCACGGASGGSVTGKTQDSDPVAQDFPVFYVKRALPTDEDMQDLDDARRLLTFETGADLYMRSRATASAREINLTGSHTMGRGAVRDTDVSFDGKKVVFAMRGPMIEDADDDEQPTWEIWEYDIPSARLRRVIESDTIAAEGHDIMPHYLPDGRIVFSSTRQRQSRALLLDENKPQFAAQDEDNREPAFLLHVMNADGSDIHQISFNQSHDLDPEVLSNGQIVFTRREHAVGNNQMDLYRMNPDGTGLELLYGANSHNTGTDRTPVQFLSPRVLPNNQTLVVLRPFTGTRAGGDLVRIDTDNFVDALQPTLPNAGLMTMPQTRIPPNDVRTTPNRPSPGGRYRTVAPLFDGSDRLLVSYSQCRVLEGMRIVPCTDARLAREDVMEAPPLYGIYIYEVATNTQQPIVAPQEGVIFTDLVAGAPRPLPPVILDGVAGVTLDTSLVTEGVGVLHIKSVYDIDGNDTAPGGITAMRDPTVTASRARPARFLRIEKAVSLPDRDIKALDNSAFGPNRSLGMREILGYAQVEPDGSVMVKVPADVAFTLSVLDAKGRRIGNRKDHWLQVRAGEMLQCNGCHNGNANPARAHGRSNLFAAVNPGAPTSGTAFPNTTPALFADMGETMAQVRNRILCNSTGRACAPSFNVIFDDLWDPTADTSTSFDACYVSGPSDVPSDATDATRRHLCATALTTPLPTSLGCAQTWASNCRVTIHYEQHIHPLWSVDRAAGTCTTCHNPADAAAAPQVPAGQLDLTDGPSDEEATQFRAYRELLFNDNEQALNNGVLEDRMVQIGVDPVTGQPQFAPVQVSPPAVAGSARTSRFFRVFDMGGGTVDHRGFLSPAELRLLAEWLDIGAQYYNDPFAAPDE